VVVDKNERYCVMPEGAFHNLSWGDGAAVYGSLEKVIGFDNLIAAVQIQHLGCVVTISGETVPVISTLLPSSQTVILSISKASRLLS